MSDGTPAEPSPDEQNRQLRARISELEQEVAGVRRSLETAEMTLKASQDPIAMLRHSMDQAPIGFALYTDELRYRMVNKCLAEMHGIPAEDHVGRTVEEVVPRVAAQLREAFKHVMETRKPLMNWETTYETAGEPRQVRYCSERWYPLFTTGGRIYGVYCSVTDITANKRAEEELRTSRERLLLAQSSAGIATYDWDLRENVGHGSREFNPLYGLPPDDIGPSIEEWLQLIHPDDRERVRAEREQTREGGDPCDSEFRVVWPDSTIHWLYTKGKLLRDSDGNPIRMVGVNMDITDRKRAEVALRESEQRFRDMADSTPVLICASGPDKLATFFNQGWLNYTGRSMEQELGYGWTEGLHPEDRDRAIAIYSASFDARRFCQIEYRLRRADGEYRSILCSGVPRYEPGGAFAGYTASCMDITDLKRNQAVVLANQKLESLGVLAGGIAHDFNNLLGSILAESELLMEDLTDTSAAQEGVERIKSVAIRAVEIVRELMAYAGHESELFKPIDLSILVEEMLLLLKVAISKRAVFKVDLPGNLPAVRANAAQIRQVVMNLITNASEALEEQEGVISLSVAQIRPSEASWRDTPHLPGDGGHYIQLEISDTGCGMTEEIQAKIFDPFFTTKFAGRGLGLAAVQGIVRAHGGTMKLESAPGKGARFTILLPSTAQPAEDAVGLSLPTTRKDDSVSGTVLLVEDEEPLRLAVAKMLRKGGFTVIEAGDGKAAVDLFEANQPGVDVVLLDMTLPRMSGREVFVELQRFRPDVKVILTTAYSEDTALLNVGDQRPWRFIRKPYGLAELVELLRKACMKS
jgi:two-component system, cell cycle sensor histidine kinase and response regulator CckA